MTILDKIAESARQRVELQKTKLSRESIKEIIQAVEGTSRFHNREAFAFENTLKRNRIRQENKCKSKMSFICEVKKASPSKGIIADEFPYLEIAEEYVQAGADAISVLTEPEYFLGDDRYLAEISRRVHIPVLRKDFTIDEYQIYEAKMIGADAVLLICSLLDTAVLAHYLELCKGLGLSALVEVHDSHEVTSAIEAGAGIIGVNNRNLQTFQVDLENSIRLRSLVPEHIIFVAESGIKSQEDIVRLHDAGVDAVLIGETLMRSADKRDALSALKKAGN